MVQRFRHPKLLQLPPPPNPHEHRCVVYSIISSSPVIPSTFYPFPIPNSLSPIPHPPSFPASHNYSYKPIIQIYETAKRFSQPIYYNPTFINPFQKATLGICVYKYSGVNTRGIVYEAIAKKRKGYLTV